MKWFSSSANKVALIAPTLAVYLAYIVAPIFIAAYYSLTKFSGIGQPQFVGLDNYRRLLEDPLFAIALKNTVIVLVVTLVLLIPGAFGLALLMRRAVRGMAAVRAVNFSPAIIAPILVGLIWVFILDPQIGLVNNVLRAVGLEALALEWIGGPDLTPFSLAIVQSWQSLGYIATIFIAGLTLIPDELYEAASLDGASGSQKLFHVTIPLLNETFKMSTILVITLVFKIFETVLQLTNGGPNHLSELLVTYMYNTTFTAGEYGYGMSIAVTTLAITFVAAGVILGLPALRRRLARTES
ncbi:carbohydrate ABC transporter permease [Cellulosimicrobium sp. CpK407]|uniref:carbohydrate ABC transporter permease n=1 Tax=Cellulosimicrobium sp. CpK407 TaxID=3229847 RepID=UPI003F36396D